MTSSWFAHWKVTNDGFGIVSFPLIPNTSFLSLPITLLVCGMFALVLLPDSILGTIRLLSVLRCEMIVKTTDLVKEAFLARLHEGHSSALQA